MPVLSQTPNNTYVGNGSVTVFAYTFRIPDAASVRVLLDNVEQLSGYSVSGVDSNDGGNVTFTVAPPNDVEVRFERAISIERETDYIEGGALPAQVLDNDFDRIVMMVQDLEATTLQSFGSSIFDAEGRRLANVADPILPQDAATKNYVDTAGPSLVAQAAVHAATAAAQAAIAVSAASSSSADAATALAQAAIATAQGTIASDSAVSAAADAASANISEGAASDSADDALASEIAAAASAAAAAISASTANSDASAASTSASNASTSAAIATAAAGALTGVVSGKILGRSTAGTGAVEQLDVGAGLALASGTLSAVTGVPVGAMFPFPANAAPTGYLKANGALVSRTTYAALWAFAQASGNLSASDGAWQAGMFSPGNGTTTFRLPDLRGEFVRGWDDSRGVDTSRAIGTTQASDNLAHSHGVSDPGHSHPMGGQMMLYGQFTNISSVLTQAGAQNTSAATTGISVGSSGGTEARPRNVSLLYCIKH